MNSPLFQSIGLGGIDVAYIVIALLVLILILFIMLIVTMVKQSNLKKRYESFMRGANGKSLEREFREVFTDIDFLKDAVDENAMEIRNIYKRLKTTYQKLGLVKYDAFNQMGGQLSFCLAMLDENNDGFVLNSVHSSDGCYSYTKDIRKGQCELSLGQEEQEALQMAMNNDRFAKLKKKKSKNEQ